MYNKVSNNWSKWTDSQVVNRRAGGRRAYNALRRDLAALRRLDVADLLLNKGLRQSDIARQLKVSRSTICRDVQALWAEVRRALGYRLPR